MQDAEAGVHKLIYKGMYNKSFKIDDKLQISRHYLIPECIEKLGFKDDDIIIEDSDIKKRFS